MSLLKSINMRENDKLRMMRCFYGTLRNIIWHYCSIDLATYSGKECFFIHKGEFLGLPVIGRKVAPLWDDLEKHGFEYVHKNFTNANDAWDDLHETLKNDIFSLIFLDTYYLVYSIFYQTVHSEHSLCVTGLVNDRLITIHDPGFKFNNKEVEKEMIDVAWRNSNYVKVDILKPTKIVDLDYDEFVAIVNKNVRNMLEKNNNFSELSGIDTIRSLSHKITDFIKNHNYKENLVRVANIFSRIAEETELHASFLFNMSEKFQLSKLEKMANELFYISQDWKLVNNMMVKASFRDTEDLIKRCQNKIQDISNNEEKFFETISHYVK